MIRTRFGKHRKCIERVLGYVLGCRGAFEATWTPVGSILGAFGIDFGTNLGRFSGPFKEVLGGMLVSLVNIIFALDF